MLLRALPVLLIAGCFDSGARDLCAEDKICHQVDDEGCCFHGGGPIGVPSRTVSICDDCPRGMAETCSTDVDDSRCVESCVDRIQCVPDLGDGCCADSFPTATTCTACPIGTTPLDDCAAFPPACGCSLRALVPPRVCVEDLGDGSCGAVVEVTTPVVCGCPEGTIEDYRCGVIGPSAECRTDHGEGCCGMLVESSGGRCPHGGIDTTMCTELAEPGVEVPEFECLEIIDEETCCTNASPFNVCRGSCPEGSRPSVDCVSAIPCF